MSILSRLSAADLTFLRRGAKAAAAVERRGHKALDAAFDAAISSAADSIMYGERDAPPVDFLPLLVLVCTDAMYAAFTTQPRVPNDAARLAAGKPIKMPSNPAELRLWWDNARKGNAPKRILALADKIKRAYIGSVQKVWAEASETFRQGQVWDQTAVKVQIAQAVQVAKSRARTIVATETTRYYNKARRSYYDKLPTVTHYLFVAVRDKRTTRWCNTRQGVVYEKGTLYLTRETPPCHFNCRSEILPLSPYNKNHKALIADESLQRINRKPEPLPEGWNK